jgi:hypothetical protein
LGGEEHSDIDSLERLVMSVNRKRENAEAQIYTAERQSSGKKVKNEEEPDVVLDELFMSVEKNREAADKHNYWAERRIEKASKAG